MTYNSPNILTILRIILIPVMIGVFFIEFKWSSQLTAIIFLIAAITDWFDGHLARRWEKVSKFGAFFDPVADKLVVAAALFLIVSDNQSIAVIISSIIIVGREIAISALREWMAELGKRSVVAVNIIGKMKTALQMTAIVLVLWKQPVFDIEVYTIGLWLLYIAAAITLYSLLSYLKDAWPHFRE